MLIGFSGFCEKCGVERRIYFARSSEQIRDLMLHSLSSPLKYKGACENCLLHGLMDSVKDWRLMARIQVDKDLSVLGKGFANIDWSKAEDDAKENLKNDVWLDDNEKHVKEYIKYRGKEL